MLTTFSTSSHAPKLHILDNEASSILKKSLLKNKIQYQLVSPHIHRRNAAEQCRYPFLDGIHELRHQRIFLLALTIDNG
jgi:hypothetical protein